MSTEWIDLGDGHAYRFFSFKPDRDLNPQYDGIPDIDRFGALVKHSTPSGEECMGSVIFRGAEAERVESPGARWDVGSWEPLTLSPSLLCSCGDHGFIRGGRWVRA